MKKLRSILLLLVLSISILTACQKNNSVQNEVSDALGIDVSNGTEMTYQDSHGGFHGDGLTFTTIKFSDDTVLASISENRNWHVMPLTEELSALVYGITTDNSRIGPYLTDENGEAVMPEIQNGYYYFVDRYYQNGGDRNDSDLLNRYSFNFTISIYDTDTNTLYYAEYDS